MFSAKDLKEVIRITSDRVECPVSGCSNHVERQFKAFRREQQFRCPDHNIYISPSTFEYGNYRDNLLWIESDDTELLEGQIMPLKRESRMGRDNSEDALTWNVFRYLEKTGLICDFIQHLSGMVVINPEMVYWSYSQSQKGIMDLLDRARHEFELVPDKGSEPDLIISSVNSLVFIEAKLTAGNNTKPSNMKVQDQYVSGGGSWWESVFASGFQEVACEDRKYELARFWLLGTWMAKQMNKSFSLINLVREGQEESIELIFGKHIVQDECFQFRRITWESIYDFISSNALPNASRDKIIDYFKNKSIGYDRNGKLQMAFKRVQT